MKKLVFCLFLVFTAGIAFGQANVPAIVVSTFTTRGQAVTADDAESITELFIAELAKQGGVRVVDRTSLDRVITEMRFQTSDWSNSQKTAQLGAALNAEFLVRGQVNQLGQQVSFALTALDIKTLEVVSSSTQNFSVDNIFSNGYSGLFYNMSSIARGIASPIKTKMEELAKQRQEQERLQEQNSYSLVGRWFVGTPSFSDDVYSHTLDMHRKNGTRSKNAILIFYSNGSVIFQYKRIDAGDYFWYNIEGQYRRQNDRLELSLTGRYQIMKGQGWNSRKNEFDRVENISDNITFSSSGTIRFTNNGNGLVMDMNNYYHLLDGTYIKDW
jgi:TolB-like protein